MLAFVMSHLVYANGLLCNSPNIPYNHIKEFRIWELDMFQKPEMKRN